MSESNRSYRVKTNINGDKNLNIQINSDYDILEILSLKIETENIYKQHTSSYGCVVGRVLANGGVGVPNAKISIFIAVDDETSENDILYNLYPYTTTETQNGDRIRYNLLPDEEVSRCHRAVGTMPNKRLLLDDNNRLEIFDKYYKFTTVTNNSGDYMIFGVPVGNQILHMDVDLSDIGFLSQKPIDMIYKGYNASQFENAQQFKKDTNINNLTQIISENTSVFVNPFWGSEENSDEISITRHDINIDYKFEPTCIFMGSIVTDSSSNGISKQCVPTPNMGRMSDLVSGNGTIEMIRKTLSGDVEEYSISGNELIDGNGVWCYQIPMNLDYVTTDEYGNLVPTDDINRGIPTRTRVRFRVSLSDFDSDYSNNHLVKILVPNNPKINREGKIEPDYVFGTNTKDNVEGSESFRDLFWNNVYTVKSYIPRIQKGNYQKTNKFTGIKRVNVHGNNNPIPYNNMRVNITFMFTLQCAIIKALIFVARVYNKMLFVMRGSINGDKALNAKCMTLGDGLCPDLEGWYFAPACQDGEAENDKFIDHTLEDISDGNVVSDEDKDVTNKEGDENYCLNVEKKPKYFLECVELNLAMENDVIQFDFYNDWINGLLYIPRWFVKVKKKGSFFFGLIKIKPKIKACMEDGFKYTRKFVQQCALDYKLTGDSNMYSTNVSTIGCTKRSGKEKCHKTSGRKSVKIFGKSNGGIVHHHSFISESTNSKGENVSNTNNLYYVKPCELNNGKKCNLFATDIVLLGSINDYNLWGIPNEFDGMQSSTFQMPPNLVQTNMDSDGVLYGVSGSGQYRCTSNEKGKTIEKLNPTFENFNKWVSESDGKDNQPDIDEYAVSEISGIDWGLSGPNQGKNNGLYKPGGHFLGIACTHSEVNIKSCVNLSRICELGSVMSQRQYIIKNNEDGTYDYEYIIPSGLISKNEISDTNYRNIFATLNHNGLKTITNVDGTRKYNFISIQPINFGGELSGDIVKYDNYNKKTFDNDGKYGSIAYFKTIEDTSADYYYFRLGVNSDTSINDVKSKYLINGGTKVSLPIYENSYYFYYGLKSGDTAMDKFLKNYYAVCPSPLNKHVPNIDVTVERDFHICGDKGVIKITINNMFPPYQYIITMDDNIVKTGISLSDIIQCENLEGGAYTVTINKLSEDVSLSKKVVVNEILDDSNENNFTPNSLLINTNNFIVQPKIEEVKIGELTVEYLSIDDIDSTILINKIDMYDDEKKGPYVYGIFVEDDMYYSYKLFVENDALKNNIYNIFRDKTLITKFSTKIVGSDIEEVRDVINIDENEGNGYISPWNNGYYNIGILYSCKKTDELSETIESEDIKKYIISDFLIDSETEIYDYYLYNESLPLSTIKRCLVGVSNTSQSGDMYNVADCAKVDVDKIDLNGSKRSWKIKKSMIYDNSITSLYGKTINVGVVNATPPYKTTIKGYEEVINEDGVDIVVTQNSNSVKTYDVSSLNDILIPTNTWMYTNNNDGRKKEFGDVLSNDTPYATKDKNYIYDVTDGDGYHPLIVLTKTEELFNPDINIEEDDCNIDVCYCPEDGDGSGCFCIEDGDDSGCFCIEEGDDDCENDDCFCLEFGDDDNNESM